MEDRLIMSRKERQRKVILEQVINGHLRREDGAKRLQIGGRQSDTTGQAGGLMSLTA